MIRATRRECRTARKNLGKPIVYVALLQAPVTLSMEGFVKRTPSYSEGLGGKLSDFGDMETG
jgi:hypothetical protein